MFLHLQVNVVLTLIKGTSLCNECRPLEKTATNRCRIPEPSPSGHIYKGSHTKGLGNIPKRGWKDCKSQDEEFAVRRSPSNVRSVPISSPTWPPKRELNMDNHRHSEEGGERLMRAQSYTRNYRRLRNAECARSRAPRGRAHQWVTQWQMVSPENRKTSSIIQTENLFINL